MCTVVYGWEWIMALVLGGGSAVLAPSPEELSGVDSGTALAAGIITREEQGDPQWQKLWMSTVGVSGVLLTSFSPTWGSNTLRVPLFLN